MYDKYNLKSLLIITVMGSIFYKGVIFFKDTCYYTFIGSMLFSGAFIFTTVVFSNLLNIDFKSINQAKTLEKDNEEEEINFEDEYKEELYAVTDWQKTYTEEELKNFRENIVHLETPNGEVIMFYDYENEAFHYYCDSKTNTYKALETVARKYALNYDCKSLYHDMDKELKTLKEKSEEEKKEKKKENEELEKKEEEDSINQINSWNPFAIYKSYKIETNENNAPKIKNKINKFKYLGKLEEYNKSITDNTKQDFVEIDYASFKKKNE